ncbi:MAG: GyrI-like domain-containing protein [Chloroflexota bacterium]
MQVTLEDIKVMCIVARGGLEGIKDAWDKLEAPLPSLKGRKFYGTYLNGEYRACVALRDDDDPAALGLDTWTIPGGTYVHRKIQNWSERTSEIGQTFAAMAAEYPIDPMRPGIEFYRSQKELILYMPIKSETQGGE